MIYVFRKEMRKWHTVLWIVFVSLALSGVSFFFFRPKHASEMKVATVNGYPVYFETYRRALAEINSRLESLRPLAAAYGMSEEAFFNMFLGVAKPEEMALDTCVNEALLNVIKDEFKVTIDSAWFAAALAKGMPQFVDASGKINMDMYQRYLQRMATTPAEYEKSKMGEFKREVVQNIVSESAYVPKFIARDIFECTYASKSFVVASFPFSHFLHEVKKETVDEKRLEDYYMTHKESYRVSEKRKAAYWSFNPEEYVGKVDVEPSLVQQYYERHKSSLFRIPPKVKVRRIFIKHAPTARDVAHDVYQQLTKDPSKFAELAKKYSEDTKTAASGGVVDFFSKGTYDKEFEAAAFRLKTNGDISKVTKTQEGYEIVQLVDRIKAGEKDFDSVKEEIIKGMRVRRASSSIRSDLEGVVRAFAEDNTSLERFVKKHNLKEEHTDWLTEKDAQASELDGAVAKKLFASNKRQNFVGFFNFKDKYVVFQCTGVEPSSVPSFEKVRHTVLDRYQHEAADARAKNSLKLMRSEILDKKLSFDEAVAQFSGKVSETKAMTKAEGEKGLAWADASFREKLFALTDVSQVLEHKHKDEYYLASLQSASFPEGVTFEAKYPQIIKQEKYKAGKIQGSAFIASLHRNAKIETDRKILDSKSTDMREE